MDPTGNALQTTTTEAVGFVATHWPLLTVRDVNRLRFLLFCKETGRIRPAAAVRVEVEALCAELLADIAQPTEELEQRATAKPVEVTPASTTESARASTPSLVAARGVPATWAKWATLYGTLRPDRAGRRSQQNAD